MGKNSPQLIIANLTNIATPSAQMGKACNGIGSRATRHFSCGADLAIKRNRAIHINQLHHTFLHLNLVQKRI